MQQETGGVVMNVYDFDNTIYRGDSTADFVGYCFIHQPRTLLSLPRTAVCGLLYVLHLMPKLVFKQNLYHMFVFLKDKEVFLDSFVASHQKNIKDWYKEQQRDDDLVISASPEFLIEKMCTAAGIAHCMASKVKYETGHYDGLNCHGKEKVRRFHEVYPDGKIEEFYSDSLSDSPLAELAEQAYLIHGDERKVWPK